MKKWPQAAGFSDLHPLQPASTTQGALALMEELSRWLLAFTGMDAVALSPKAGAHGELCGMMAIKAAIAARGESGDAHGGSRAGFRPMAPIRQQQRLSVFTVRSVPAGDDGHGAR